MLPFQPIGARWCWCYRVCISFHFIRIKSISSHRRVTNFVFAARMLVSKYRSHAQCNRHMGSANVITLWFIRAMPKKFDAIQHGGTEGSYNISFIHNWCDNFNGRKIVAAREAAYPTVIDCIAGSRCFGVSPNSKQWAQVIPCDFSLIISNVVNQWDGVTPSTSLTTINFYLLNMRLSVSSGAFCSSIKSNTFDTGWASTRWRRIKANLSCALNLISLSELSAKSGGTPEMGYRTRILKRTNKEERRASWKKWMIFALEYHGVNGIIVSYIFGSWIRFSVGTRAQREQWIANPFHHWKHLPHSVRGSLWLRVPQIQTRENESLSLCNGSAIHISIELQNNARQNTKQHKESRFGFFSRVEKSADTEMNRNHNNNALQTKHNERACAYADIGMCSPASSASWNGHKIIS